MAMSLSSMVRDPFRSSVGARTFTLGLLLALAAFCVYLRAIHGQFLWDDDDYVTRNLALRSLAGLAGIWFHPGSLSQYYPMTYTSFWIDYHLWGLWPTGYHLVNNLLHAVNALLVWRLLDQLKLKYAWFVALLFAVHPVHVESVAWITERKNLLSGCFFLLSLGAYLRTRYTVSYLLFLGALGSKTVTATLPAVLWILLWWKNAKVSRGDWLRLAFFVVTELFVSSVSISLESRHVLRMGTPDWDLTFPDRILIAGRAVWFYFGKVLLPHPLIFFYPRWTIDPRELGQWVYPVAFMFALGALWLLRKKAGRGPFAAFLIYAVLLFPALGFKNYYPMRFSFVADHFQYLASIASLALAVACFSFLLEEKRIRIAVAGCVLVMLAVLTWDRQAAFMSLESLWRDTIRKNPLSWIARNNYGAFLMDHGRQEEAEIYFDEAIRIHPKNSADAFNNLGLMQFKKGKLEKAMFYYQKAIQLQPGRSLYHVNLGTLYLELGKTEEAASEYRTALDLNPQCAEAYFSLGNISLQKGNIALAEEELRKAALFNPDHADTYTTLGFVCAKLGKNEEALRYYEKAIGLDPRQAFAHNNLANALSAQGLFEKANAHYREAMALQPASFQFRANFADSLRREGKADEAEKYYQEALRLEASGSSQRKDPRILTQPTPQADPA